MSVWGDYGHYIVDWGDVKKMKLEQFSKKMDNVLDSDNGTKDKIKFHCAKIFKDKTGWTVYGARLENEQWVVEDMHDGCLNGDAYDDILRMFETSITLESILYKLKDACYISDYRKMNALHIDRFEYRLQDWIVELMKYNLKAESDEFYKEVFTEEKVNDMGLRIKKTDVLSIDEFKENDKAYDEVKINIDDEKLKKFEEDYGVYDFTIYLCRYVKICDEVIEFLPKALCIESVHCVPYEFIQNIECTYYLKTE